MTSRNRRMSTKNQQKFRLDDKSPGGSPERVVEAVVFNSRAARPLRITPCKLNVVALFAALGLLLYNTYGRSEPIIEINLVSLIICSIGFGWSTIAFIKAAYARARGHAYEDGCD